MKIYRPINNNVVSAFDSKGQEVIVIGTGIGYKAKAGAPLKSEDIQKIFRMSTREEAGERMDRHSVPEEYLELTEEIFTFARDCMHKKLRESALIALADHIHFAVERFRQGILFQNMLLTEVRRFFPQEYSIGKYALDLIEQKIGVCLADDEAAAIALHIFNAEYDLALSDIFYTTKLLDQILEIIAQDIGSKMDESNYYWERFITHLKFLCQRIVRGETLPDIDDEFMVFISMAAQRYAREMKCAHRIADLSLRAYGFVLSCEEVANLTMHLKRISIKK